MTPLYLSRATLRSVPSLESLAPVLAPTDPAARSQVDHRLVWSLFAEDRDATRDFLFRREDRGAPTTRACFLILSRRPPDRASPLFDVETKEFAPALAKGDRLGFSLLANPAVTHWRVVDGKKVRRRDDVVMHALATIPSGERTERRPQIIEEEGRRWLESQGARTGFAISATDALKIDGYDQIEIDRDPVRARTARGKQTISASILSFDGCLTIVEPELFLESLARGFGRARAFGCGLMLIRRVR
ncbi:type I-E CRISPR-associated protein Cas6/Cse3/CasE [Methylosinus sp. KRF6]|uniref:type I-E CRISPR-associated protein Cas6/Cse3/CasE n=1 Tax=Methylosinus sp. KRF6 TaxID=2846853 RepID=UPI001C0BB660|nr:type I-E CRISPR-associated protein Cas6/Cse3/CasE [Methylosinus sp. KRF6]MBU3890988.1 type I-E CRISPR-associated protein Cas6/Cse3/CasE [Methylosinus sp. KRF6]